MITSERLSREPPKAITQTGRSGQKVRWFRLNHPDFTRTADQVIRPSSLLTLSFTPDSPLSGQRRLSERALVSASARERAPSFR